MRFRAQRIALLLGVSALALATPAAAQSDSGLLRPSLTDPLNPQQFGGAPDATVRDRQSLSTPPSAAGLTGFVSSGAKKPVKRRPGERNLGGKVTPLASQFIPGPPQALVRPQAPQIGDRITYADAYKPPDASSRLRRPLVPFNDAFEPIGVRVGDILLRPSIEISRGTDSNPGRVPGGRSSQFTLVTPELRAQTLWLRHEAGAVLRGSYSNYDSAPLLNRPSADGRIYGRIDANRDLNFDVEARGLIGTDNPGSPNVQTQAGLAELPVFTSIGGGGGVTQRINRLELSAKAGVDRIAFQDSKLTDGTTFSNRDRDYLQYGVSGRVGYEYLPGFKPFVELAADRRDHDLNFDRNGLRRDSQSLTPRAGTTFEFTRWLTGELSVGYLMRQFKDPSLQDVNGIVADGALIWTATGLTTATLNARSRAEESIVPGVSAALRRDIGVRVDHSFRRWLIGTLSAGYGYDDYRGLGRQDTRTSLGAALTYKFNRDVSVTGELRQEWLRSNVTGVDYAASIALLGLKLAR